MRFAHEDTSYFVSISHSIQMKSNGGIRITKNGWGGKIEGRVIISLHTGQKIEHLRLWNADICAVLVINFIDNPLHVLRINGAKILTECSNIV